MMFLMSLFSDMKEKPWPNCRRNKPKIALIYCKVFTHIYDKTINNFNWQKFQIGHLSLTHLVEQFVLRESESPQPLLSSNIKQNPVSTSSASISEEFHPKKWSTKDAFRWGFYIAAESENSKRPLRHLRPIVHCNNLLNIVSWIGSSSLVSAWFVAVTFLLRVRSYRWLWISNQNKK